MSKPRKRWRTTATIQARAKELRRDQTPAEARLWWHLRGKQLHGLKLRRQHPVGHFILDFYCASAKLAIELDGDSHAEQEAYDQARTEWLAERGYRVIRFTDRQVERNLETVLAAIADECAE
jgi:very-short-patch-repair endonuclease